MSKSRLFEILASAVFIAVLIYSYDIASVVNDIGSFNARSAAIALFAVFGSLALAFARFRVVVAVFGFAPPASIMARAFIVGQFSNQFLANIFGQSISRAALLHQSGVPFSVTIFATWAERGLALFLLLIFAAAGAALFIGSFVISTGNGGAYLASVVLGCGLALLFVFGIAVWRFGTGVLGAWPRQRVALAITAVLLTVAVQGMMLFAYMACISSLGIDPWRTDIAAALLVVMMVSSLPISFAGWGLRELSAVQALALVGIGPAIAIGAGVMIGVLSLIAMAVMAVLLAGAAVRYLAEPHQATPALPGFVRNAEWDRTLLWICSLLISALIFFHVHVPLRSNMINVNPADAVALSALCIALLSLVVHRSPGLIVESWIWPGVGAITALIVFATLVAYVDHGASQWAIVNRGIGWLVILGYVVAGVAAGRVAGEAGRETILLSFVTIGFAIIGYQLAALELSRLSVELPLAIVSFPLEGFAENSNSFALQVVYVLIASIVLAYANPRYKWLLAAAITLSAIATFWSQSRTGWILAALVIGPALVVFSQAKRTRHLLICAVVASVVGTYYFAAALAYLQPGSLQSPQTQFAARVADTVVNEKRTGLRRSENDTTRWQSIVDGLMLWRSSPIVGAGLGGHVTSKAETSDEIVGIHSTPVWILAEFGILGLAIAICIIWHWLRNAMMLFAVVAERPYAAGFLLLLGTLAIGGLVHDLAYQRIFWFLAALMATPVLSQKESRAINSCRSKKSTLSMQSMRRRRGFDAGLISRILPLQAFNFSFCQLSVTPAVIRMTASFQKFVTLRREN